MRVAFIAALVVLDVLGLVVWITAAILTRPGR